MFKNITENFLVTSWCLLISSLSYLIAYTLYSYIIIISSKITYVSLNFVLLILKRAEM